jgi:hypothetical protein
VPRSPTAPAAVGFDGKAIETEFVCISQPFERSDCEIQLGSARLELVFSSVTSLATQAALVELRFAT